MNPSATDIHCFKKQKEKPLLPFPDLISEGPENIVSGYLLQILRDWILTSKENADSHMTQLKVTGKTKHLFRSYSVCFYRDMLPRIIDSGRFFNAHSAVHILVCSHGHLRKMFPVAPDPAICVGISRLWYRDPCFSTSWLWGTMCLGSFLLPAYLWASSSLVCHCRGPRLGVCPVPACAVLSWGTPVRWRLLSFPSPTSTGRIPYVSPEL